MSVDPLPPLPPAPPWTWRDWLLLACYGSSAVVLLILVVLTALGL